ESVEKKASLRRRFDEQQRLVSADISRYSTRLGEARIQRIELAARLKSLEDANRNDPMDVVHAAIPSSQTVESLRSMYLTAIGQRRSLALKYGDNHPQIQALDTQLTNYREE